MVCVDQIVLTQAVTFITEYVLSAILHVPRARVAGLITAYSVKICITWTVDFVLLNVQQTNIRWVTGHVDVRVAVNNALINPRLSARNVSSLQTLSSTALAYHPAPPTPFSLGTNVCNVQTTALNAQLEHHVPNVHHHTTFMRENVTLTVIRYLSNMMLKVMLVCFVLQDVILVQIMCVILVWKGIRKMTRNV